MANLPSFTGRQFIQALERARFSTDRVSGSHHIMKKVGIPMMTVDEFLKYHQLHEGELLLVSTEILESAFGIYKQLEGQQSKSGFQTVKW